MLAPLMPTGWNRKIELHKTALIPIFSVDVTDLDSLVRPLGFVGLVPIDGDIIDHRQPIGRYRC